MTRDDLCKPNHMTAENFIPPTEIEKYLAGVNYPANKADLITAAEDNGAPENIIDKIENLPGNDFETSKDVMRALGHIE